MKYRIHRDERLLVADVTRRGPEVLSDPILNKGTAFDEEERKLLALEGLLPHRVTDRKHQVKRAWDHVMRRGDDPVGAYIAMAALQDRNETLFYQVLSEHVEELLPIVYTPTVGTAAVGFSHIFRRGRGLWITPAHRGRIDEILGNARSDEIHLIVVTDNERILGLGDQGAGGMVIPVGKLALYTLAAGIHPAYTLPVSLDVGTDNAALLADDLYVGWPHPRLRGEAYDSLVEEFVVAVHRRWPKALLQFEDFKKVNACRLLDRYRARLACFNDDIQGTGAVTVAGLLAACRAAGVDVAQHRVLLVGAGAAGVGIARQLRRTVAAAGGSAGNIALFDTVGLVVDDRTDLDAYKAEVAWPAAAASGVSDRSDLMDVVATFQPTAIIGTTGTPGIFTEPVIRAMATSTERPLVMPLSNPTSHSEAAPADIVAWTDGRALIATGSPFPPVAHGDRTIPVPQCNNVYVFPGIGLGSLAAGAGEVTDAMFDAAARTLAGLTTDSDLQSGRLYPPLTELRSITRQIAREVARAAREGGAGRPLSDAQIEEALDLEIWDFSYPRLSVVST